MNKPVKKLLPLFLGRKPAEVSSYGERLSELTQNLTSASKQVDSVLKELAQVAKDREAAAARLEAELKALEQREERGQVLPCASHE